MHCDIERACVYIYTHAHTHVCTHTHLVSVGEEAQRVPEAQRRLRPDLGLKRPVGRIIEIDRSLLVCIRCCEQKGDDRAPSDDDTARHALFIHLFFLRHTEAHSQGQLKDATKARLV